MKSKRRIVLPAKCRDECYTFDIFYASSCCVLSMHFFTVEFHIKIRSRVNSPLVVRFNESRINDLGNNCFLRISVFFILNMIGIYFQLFLGNNCITHDDI